MRGVEGGIDGAEALCKLLGRASGAVFTCGG